MTRIEFTKGHGTGNDFIVIADPSSQLDLSARQVSKLCDRHFGIGADGVLRAVFDSEWFMDYRNADGSIAEMCGNGIRVFAEYLFRRGLIESVAHINTRAGIKRVERIGESMWNVDIGRVTSDDAPTQLVFNKQIHQGISVDVGNPHVVVNLDNFGILPAKLQWSDVSKVESQPDGFNLEFYEIHSETSVSMRVLERGVGETLSCGTGVCAVAYVHMQNVGRDMCEVKVPGGILHVEKNQDGLRLIGPAELIADGFVEFN